MEIRQTDRLTVKILPGREEMGRCAAADAADAIRALQKTRAEVNIIFAAAPSQNETLAALIEEPGIVWEKINAFHMDEYLDLPENSPARFSQYLQEHIFGKVPFHAVYTIWAQSRDSRAEAARYAALLAEHPADIVMLGIGENGHIAFNDPAVADFADPAPVKEVQLDEMCRNQQVHDGCFPSLEQVPRRALTLTVPTLMAAGQLFCSVPGSTKAQAVYRTLHGEIGEECPATAMRRHPHATLYCDADSAQMLK